jgi:hypothetical protein
MLVLPASAQGATTAFLDPPSFTVAGCQAKALNGFGVPGTGALATGAYSYVVVATAAGADLSPSCPPVEFAVEGTQNTALLQWSAIPGATGYRVYRRAPAEEYKAVEAAPGVTELPAGNVCTSGSRCQFLDKGGPATPMAPPPPPATEIAGGSHPDLELVQRVDYGGADTTSPADDPFPASLKTDVVHLPPGLGLATGTITACPLSGPASLLGDTAARGSDDPNEDTCPRVSLVGSAMILARTSSGVSTIPGEIYVGTAKTGEAGRLYIVGRPACSAGSIVAPGSPSCAAQLGASDRQLEKLFLAMPLVGTAVNGEIALEGRLVQASDDGDLPPTFTVLTPTGAGGALAPGGSADLQIRRLAFRLSGMGQLNTLSAADDVAFVTMPSFCGEKQLSVTMTTSLEPTAASASRIFSPSPCATPPSPPPATGNGSPPGGARAGFGSSSLVTLKLASKRIPASGPIKVRVANANPFAVDGSLGGRASAGRGKGKRRAALRGRVFAVAANGAAIVKLSVPAALRSRFKATGKLGLQLKAAVTDPTNAALTLEASARAILKRSSR